MVKQLEEKDDLQHVLGDLKPEIDTSPSPSSLRVYGVIRALLSGKASENIYVDDWPSWTVLIAAPTQRPKPEGFPVLLPSVTIHNRGKSTEHVQATMESVLQWDKHYVFTSVSKWLEDYLTSSYSNRGSFSKLMECETMKCTESELLERPTPVPESYRLTTVMPPMAGHVTAQWRKKSPEQTTDDDHSNSIRLVEYSSTHFPSSCLIDSSHQPVAHVMCHYYGAVGMLGLSNQHKGQGLSAVVLHDLCRKLSAQGQPIWAHIEKDNLPAAELFCRTGFTVLKNMTTSWLAFTPHERPK